MTLTTFLLQAVASFLAIITFLIVLNVQRSMLLPGGILGMTVWLIYLLLKEPTNVIVATFIAAIIGSCVSQILSILYKTPAVVFILAILAPLVPGYLSYRTTAFFVTGDYNKALASATLVVMLALVISIGMASGTVILRLYHYKHIEYRRLYRNKRIF
ncbi:threonine/serine exporter family protein [Streptococcus pneumoniae]|nr:threonine/serine exporter family protein [Streptococcus pneumoniae]MDS3155044.1 threonine/serine exporter family protein [Streptococcus pneumoniae]MDS3168626.1 threonine/serine exporter family protein [Streptococcus pneumoniae]MDS9429595.1 threonine/serine exporter family protein [Streptococcus pneumoniae]MDT6144382.1 threonine/serine exporter family protein [Streptococcus pneumoniae]